MILVIVAIGCGPAGRGNSGDDGDDDTTPDSDTSGGDGSNNDGCSDDAKLIYVVDANKTLSKFDPQTKQFMDLGALNCPAGLMANPFSMGIDRNANAYVLYSPAFAIPPPPGGELFKVDTKTLNCTKTAWQPNAMGHSVFGMGFSTDTMGGTTDTLFIAGGPGPTQPSSTLATMSMTSFAPTNVGSVTGWPELTGTGNAELWGFFPANTDSRVVKLDKTTGAAAQTFTLPTLNGDIMNGAWAFAFYGGDFFIFLQRSGEPATTVYQMNGMTGAITGMTPTNTRRIVGAGVSTCAPVIIF